MPDCLLPDPVGPVPVDAAPGNTPRQLPRPPTRPLRWLHVDAQLIAIDKPAGLLSVPGLGPAGGDCASAQVQARYPDALIVHRLDMGTSGLLVFGRGTAAQRALSQAFEQRQVDKRYVAQVAGSVAGTSGRIELPLMADWPRRPLQKICPQHGKPALTLWQLLAHEASGHSSRLALQPVTGRTHQLRVHLQAIGHPILGDELYAPPEIVAAAPRLLLHAECLELPHPGHGGRFVIESPAEF